MQIDIFPFGKKLNIQKSYYFSLEIFVQLNASTGTGTVCAYVYAHTYKTWSHPLPQSTSIWADKRNTNLQGQQYAKACVIMS